MYRVSINPKPKWISRSNTTQHKNYTSSKYEDATQQQRMPTANKKENSFVSQTTQYCDGSDIKLQQ